MRTTMILVAILILSAVVHVLTVTIAIVGWGLLAGSLFASPYSVLVGMVGGVPIGAYAMWGFSNMPDTPCCVALCRALDHFGV